jgi:hypothetical protein
MESVSIPQRFGRIGVAMVALLGAGCTSADLSNDAKETKEVIECLPTNAPAPSLIERAIWFPKASGFGSTDASMLGHLTGILALAGDTLYFMVWNDPERHFDMRQVIAVTRIANIRVARFGTSAMLVVQLGNDSFDSFELMNGGGFGSDPKATQEIFEKLEALLAKNPPSGF